jgi:FkbM family methyltransferase
MIDYDFIEIGTSDYDTLIEVATDETIGLSIEPIEEYLNSLPNKKNVTKVNAAISIDGTSNDVEIFYIPRNVIVDNDLHPYWGGCNIIGKMHPMYVRNQTVKENIKSKLVKQITIKELYSLYNIHKVKFLKIDTEGYDCDILQHWLDFLKGKDKSYYPQKIEFESNSLTPQKYVLQTIEDYVNFGYKLIDFSYGDKQETSTLQYD